MTLSAQQLMQRSASCVRCLRTAVPSEGRFSAGGQQVRQQTNGAARGKPLTEAEQAAAAAQESTPPSAAAAVATMGAGGDCNLSSIGPAMGHPSADSSALNKNLAVVSALGAVAVAAVGVWGVFKMAMAVAEGTGRTLNSNHSSAAPVLVTVSGPQSSEADSLLPMQPAVPSGPVYPPSSQHRKVAEEGFLGAHDTHLPLLNIALLCIVSKISEKVPHHTISYIAHSVLNCAGRLASRVTRAVSNAQKRSCGTTKGSNPTRIAIAAMNLDPMNLSGTCCWCSNFQTQTLMLMLRREPLLKFAACHVSSL